MYHYDPLVLAFVLNLQPPALSIVKSQIIECIQQIEDDDRGYVYHPNNLEILRHSGPVVGSIANYQTPQDFNLESAIEQTVALVETQDTDAKKYIFIILDEYEPNQEYSLKKGLNIPTDAKCIVISVSGRCHPSLSQVVNCQFIFDKSDNVGRHIVQIAEINNIKSMAKKMIG